MTPPTSPQFPDPSCANLASRIERRLRRGAGAAALVLRRAYVPCAVAAAGLSPFPQAYATALTIDGTTIVAVSVNGGADTVNPGTSCIRISTAVSPACPGGFLAIPNNNKQLIAAALLTKTAGSRVWIFYDDAAGSLHCPGQVFTPCSVIGIESN